MYNLKIKKQKTYVRSSAFCVLRKMGLEPTRAHCSQDPFFIFVNSMFCPVKKIRLEGMYCGMPEWG